MSSLTVSAAVTNATTNRNGSITLTVSGGTTYTYAWSAAGIALSYTTQNLTNLTAGTYTVSVTSGALTGTATATVTDTAVNSLSVCLPLNGDLSVVRPAGATALVNTATTLGTASFAAGPANNNTQGLTLASGKYVQLPYLPELELAGPTLYSYGAWVYVTSGSSIMRNTDTYGTSTVGNGMQASLTGNTVVFYTNVWQNGNANLNLYGYFPSFPNNAWVHFWYASANGTDHQVYVNGVYKGSSADGGSFITNKAFWSNTGWLFCASSGFVGRLSDVRFYSGFKSPLEVMQSLMIVPGLVSDAATVGGTGSIAASTLLGAVTTTGSLSSTWTPVNGCTTSTAQAKFGGRSLLIDGNNGRYANVALAPTFNTVTSDWTLEMWFYVVSYNATFNGQSSNGYVALFSTGTGNTSKDTSITLDPTSGGRAGFVCDNNSFTPFAGVTYTLAAWNHAAICHSAVNNTFTLFLNGVKSSTSVSPTVWPDVALFDHLALGARPDIGSENINLQTMLGYIDDVRISNIVRYTTSFTPPTSAFVVDANTLSLNGFSSSTSLLAAPVPTVVWSNSTGATVITDQSLAAKTALLPGTYTLTVQDAAGKSITHRYEVANPLTLSAVSTAATTASNGSITLTVTGGKSNKIFVWKSSLGKEVSRSQSPPALCAGTYSCTVTSGTSSAAISGVVVQGPTADFLVGLPLQTDLSVCGTLGVTMTNSSVVSPNFTSAVYSGRKAVALGLGEALTLSYSPCLEIQRNVMSLGGWFKITSAGVLLSNANSALTAGITISTAVVDTVTNVVVTVYQSLKPTLTMSNPILPWRAIVNAGFNHLWFVFSTTLVTVYVDGVLATTMNIASTVSNASGLPWKVCDRSAGNTAQVATADIRFYAGYKSPLQAMETMSILPGTVVNATTTTSADGSIAAATLLGGTPPYTVMWAASSGGTTIPNQTTLSAQGSLKRAVYTCTVTDSAGVSASNTYDVGSALSINVVPTATTNDQDGSIAATISGGGALQFATLASGKVISASLTSLVPGTYAYTVLSGSQYATAYAVVQPATVHRLLAQIPANGDLTIKGALSGVSTSNPFGSPTFISGPFSTNSQGFQIAASKYFELPSSPSLQFGLGAWSFGGYVQQTNTATAYVISNDLVSTARTGVTIQLSNYASFYNTQFFANNVSVSSPYDNNTSENNLNLWRHLWLTSDGTTIRFYVNGALRFTALRATTDFTSSNVWRVGSVINPWTGAVSNLRWYQGFKSPLEVMGEFRIVPGAVAKASTLSAVDGSIADTQVLGAVGAVTCVWTSFGGSTVITDTTANAQTGLLCGTYTLTATDSTGNVVSHQYTVGTSTGAISLSLVSAVAPTAVNNGSIKVAARGGDGLSYTYSCVCCGTTVVGGTITPSFTGLHAGDYVCSVTSNGVTASLVVTLAGAVETPLQVMPLNGSLSAYGALALDWLAPATTLGGAPVYSTGPKVGQQGIVLSTTAQYLELPFHSTLNFSYSTPFSFGGWFYYDVNSGTRMQVCNASGTGDGIELYYNGGMGFSIANANKYYTTSAVTVPALTWAHFWATYDGNVVRQYLNGVLLLTGPAVGTTNSMVSTQGWTIERSRRVPFYSTTGRVADVRWYSGLTNPYKAMASLYINPGAVTLALPSASSIGTTTVLGGTPPYTVSWSSTGSVLTDQSLGAKAGLVSGLYTVQVTDAAGTYVTNTYLVPYPLVVTVASSTAPTITGNNGSITVAVAGGTGTNSYAWTSYGAAVAGTTQTLTGLFSGDYACTVTSGTQTATLSTTLVGTDVLLQQLQLNGTLTGTGPLALSPVNPTSTLGGAATYVAGPYTGSQAVAIKASSRYLELPYSPSLEFAAGAAFSMGGWFYTNIATTMYLANVASTPVSGLEFFSSSVAAGLNAWNGGSTPAQSIGGGINTALNSWAHWWLVHNGTTVTLYMNGVAKGTGTPAAGSAVSGLAWQICNSRRYNGGYNMSNGAVADVRWYSGVASPAKAMASAVLDIAGTVSNCSYNSIKDGSISAPGVAFGVAPYSYSWSDSVAITTAARTGLGPGTYMCTIRDAASAIKQYSYTVTQPAALSIVLTQINSTGSNNGSISASSASGGTAPYTYAWNTGATTAGLSSLLPGTYTLTMTDARGYSIVRSINITAPATFVPSPSSVQVSWPAGSVSGSRYRVQYSIGTSALLTTFIEGTAVTSVLVTGLAPTTSYTFYIAESTSTTTATSYAVKYTGTTTTLAASSINYTKAAFKVAPTDTVYQLSAVTAAQAAAANTTKEALVRSVFSTNDAIVVQSTTRNTTKSLTASIVRLAESIAVKRNTAIYLPFDATDSVTAQGANLVLTDASVLPVTYSAGSNQITVGSTVYTEGDVFYTADGQQVTVTSSE